MFGSCRSLSSVGVSGFDTTNVTNMSGMFSGCSNLSIVDVSGFDTSNVRSMCYMFDKCSNLTSLDLNNFKMLSIVESETVPNPTEGVLTGCDALQELHTPSYIGDETIELTAEFTNGEIKVSVLDSNTQNMVLRRVTSEDLVEDFVKCMYTVALGREAEQGGLDYWSEELKAKNKDGAGIAVEFILSAEFTGKGYSDSEFVDVLYATFFDRDADSAGNAYWCETLAGGASRPSVLSGFVNSQEFFDICRDYGISRGVLRSDGSLINGGIYRFAERLYSTILERESEKDGIEYWTCGIDNGTLTPENAAMSFFGSEEYLAKNTTDEAYIATLYHTFMDRDADEAGMEHWLEALNGESTRESILRDFAWSPEFQEIMESFGL